MRGAGLSGEAAASIISALVGIFIETVRRTPGSVGSPRMSLRSISERHLMMSLRMESKAWQARHGSVGSPGNP